MLGLFICTSAPRPLISLGHIQHNDGNGPDYCRWSCSLVGMALALLLHIEYWGADPAQYWESAPEMLAPMIEAVAKLMASHLPNEGKAPESIMTVPRTMATSKNWTQEQAKLAFHLYCQLPFGKLHKGNPEIIRLAEVIGRTPSAVAMKLVNFASLDPAITSTGRKGLAGVSSLDRQIWEEFHADWERLAVECEMLRRSIDQEPVPDEADESLVPEDFTGETRQVVTEQRIKQNFFRRAVLSSYGGRCCMSGVSEPRLLIASHIVPWSKDRNNRLNPSNGLCLSAIHDRAFDKGLITLSDDFKVIVSDELKRRDEAFVKAVFLPLDGQAIALPDRFIPTTTFVAWHRTELFVDSRRK